jgi:hypothetical protein
VEGLHFLPPVVQFEGGGCEYGPRVYTLTLHIYYMFNLSNKLSILLCPEKEQRNPLNSSPSQALFFYQNK